MALAAILLLLLAVAVSAQSNDMTMTSFILKMEDYARQNKQQSQVIAEYKGTIESLNTTIEELRASVNGRGTGECPFSL